MAVFYIDGEAQKDLNLVKGQIYRFDQSNSSNSNYILLVSEHPDGDDTLNGPGPDEYTTGVSYWINNGAVNAGTYQSSQFTNAASRFIQIEVDSNLTGPLYYYAVNPADGSRIDNMGGQIIIS